MLKVLEKFHAVGVYVSIFVLNTFPVVHATTYQKEVGLTEAVSISLANDPELAIGLATKESDSEAKQQALSGLLPNATAIYQRNPNVKSETQSANSISQNSTISRYDATSKSIQIKQPIFRPRQLYGYLQGIDKETFAEYEYKTALGNAILRSLGAYSEWLLGESSFNYQEAAVVSAKSRELRVKRMRDKGLASEPDLAQAVAEKNRAQYELSLAKEQFYSAQQNFSELMGQQKSIRPQKLGAEPSSKTLKFSNHFDDLLSKVMSSNFEVLAGRKAIEIAELEYKKSMSDHAPTVDLVASTVDSDSSYDTAIGRRIKTNSIGVLVNIPIYSGGLIVSVNRQAAANIRKARAELALTEKKVRTNFVKLYQSLETAQERWNFSNAAYKSAQLQVTLTKKQVGAGLRAQPDLDAAIKNLAQADLDVTKSKTDWLMAKAQILSMLGEVESIVGQEYAVLFSDR